MTVNINPLDLAADEVDLDSRETRPTIEVLRTVADEDQTRGEVRGTMHAQSLSPRAGRTALPGARTRRVVRDMNAHETRAGSYSSAARPASAPRLEDIPAAALAALGQVVGAALLAVSALRLVAVPFGRSRRRQHFWRAVRALGVGGVLVSGGARLSERTAAARNH